jgi:hypothetical protein
MSKSEPSEQEIIAQKNSRTKQGLYIFLGALLSGCLVASLNFVFKETVALGAMTAILVAFILYEKVADNE